MLCSSQFAASLFVTILGCFMPFLMSCFVSDYLSSDNKKRKKKNRKNKKTKKSFSFLLPFGIDVGERVALYRRLYLCIGQMRVDLCGA